MSKLVLIAPNEEMAALAHEILPELPEEVDIRFGYMDAAVELASSLNKAEVAVIISRGGTAWLLKNCGLEIPVVEVTITGKELVEAINKAIAVSGKPRPVIGYVGFENMVRNIQMYTGILNVDLRIYHVQSAEEMERQVAQAKDDGIDVVIGGILTSQFARQSALPSVTLGATREALRAAFGIAAEIKFARTLEQKKAEELKAILDSAFEAIIGSDDRGTITVFNAAAELFLKIDAGAAIGAHIRQVMGFIAESDLQQVLVEGKPVLAKIVKTHSAPVVLNFTPILVNHKVMAAILSFQAIERIQSVEAKIREELYRKGNVAEYSFKDIRGESGAIQETKRIAENFAKLDSIVLILGETGTGKELFAQSIHNASLRSQGPFVAVNCGAIPANLLESELFGYVEGAFTGAKRGGKRGLFEIAHGGTIFLDEISEMDIYGQVMLLRVIQEKQVRRVGGDRVIPVDVRIVAATNKNLVTLVEKKKFREDLYYRLNVLTLNIPPLRDRQNDIQYLLRYFISEYNKKFYKYVTLTDAAVTQIGEYPWYGNVRHLKSFCERLVALADRNELGVEIIERQLQNELFSSRFLKETHPPLTAESEANPVIPRAELDGDGYSRQIIDLLRRYHGNKSIVAKELGISRTTLWRQIKQYRIVSEFSKGS